jgi:hypothetical protein
LLDWLATDFVEHGWSLKHLHRQIVMSATYRAASPPQPTDPDNRLVSRFQPRRVEAEVVWDAMRVAAATLDRRMYGLPVFPPLDGRELIGNYKKWPADPPEAANCRAVYVVARRSFRFPPLAAFDPPENVASCGRRDTTVVPNQALTLLNNRGVRRQAEAFADRLRRETDGSPGAVSARAWLIAYSRPITDAERREAVAFLNDSGTVADLCAALFTTNEFVYLP